MTGANSPLGIGAAVARALASQGAAIALASLPVTGSWPRPGLVPGPELYAAAGAADPRYVRDEIIGTGGRATVFAADLSDPAACRALLGSVEASLGPVDILVNNAAYGVPDTFIPAGRDSFYRDSRPLTSDALDAHYAVNTRAPAILMTELHRRHRERGAGWGRVVNVSTDGATTFPSEVSYGATKYALESLSRSAAHELADAGITVNIVSPGPVQTGWISADMLPGIDRETPLGRVGTPEDVAEVVTFLVSAQARWLTGQLIFVGGGHRMI
ncbi:MAG: SDR family NAD(P)-dependent oxidoreductase [Actinoallomurus sp.]